MSWSFVESWLMPVTKLCADVEYNGILIDKPGLEAYQKELASEKEEVLKELISMTENPRAVYREMQELELKKEYQRKAEIAYEKAKNKDNVYSRYEKLYQTACAKLDGFNFGSHDQLAWLLGNYYKLDLKDSKTGKITTDEGKLRSLTHPIAEQLCKFRELEKMLNSCIPALLDNIQPDGCVHASFKIGGTRTGRLSSSGPNLQQISNGKIRSFVVASPHCSLVTIDYSQIEVRIMAHMCQDKKLITAFQNDIDPYSVIAKNLFSLETPLDEIKEKHPKERKVAKTLGLAIFYGTGAKQFQHVLRKEMNKSVTLDEARSFIQSYRESFPDIQKFKDELGMKLANAAFMPTKAYYNLLGRPFQIESNDEIYMKGLNTLIQGSSSDLVLWAQVHSVIPRLKDLNIPFKYRLLVHDEVVIELPEKTASIITQDVIVPAMTTEIEKLLQLTLPLKVEYSISKQWEKPSGVPVLTGEDVFDETPQLQSHATS